MKNQREESRRDQNQKQGSKPDRDKNLEKNKPGSQIPESKRREEEEERRRKAGPSAGSGSPSEKTSKRPDRPSSHTAIAEDEEETEDRDA